MRLAFGRIAFPSFAKQNESTAFLTRLRGIRWPVLNKTWLFRPDDVIRIYRLWRHFAPGPLQ
jgi:hypothetical protein